MSLMGEGLNGMLGLGCKNFFLELGQNQIFKIWVILIFFGGGPTIFFGMNLLVGLKQGCILNLVEFGCVGAEKKWGSVSVSVSVWFIIGK